GGLGLLWLPASVQFLIWPPFFVAVLAAGIGYLWTAIRAGHRAIPRAVTSATSALLALAALAALPGQAAAPTSYTVLLLPGLADAPDKQTVLAPPELLEQLRLLAHRGAQGLHGAALLSAHYDGSIADGVAVLNGAFQVYAF